MCVRFESQYFASCHHAGVLAGFVFVRKTFCFQILDLTFCLMSGFYIEKPIFKNLFSSILVGKMPFLAALIPTLSLAFLFCPL